jgi:hypothetical protein
VRADGKTSEFLNEWPMEQPKDWIEFVNGSERESELDDLGSGVTRSASAKIAIKIAIQLGLESAMNFAVVRSEHEKTPDFFAPDTFLGSKGKPADYVSPYRGGGVGV